jgi:hypothetical protein
LKERPRQTEGDRGRLRQTEKTETEGDRGRVEETNLEGHVQVFPFKESADVIDVMGKSQPHVSKNKSQKKKKHVGGEGGMMERELRQDEDQGRVKTGQGRIKGG